MPRKTSPTAPRLLLPACPELAQGGALLLAVQARAEADRTSRRLERAIGQLEYAAKQAGEAVPDLESEREALREAKAAFCVRRGEVERLWRRVAALRQALEGGPEVRHPVLGFVLTRAGVLKELRELCGPEAVPEEVHAT